MLILFILLVEGPKYLFALCLILFAIFTFRVYKKRVRGEKIFQKQEMSLRWPFVVGIGLLIYLLLKFLFSIDLINMLYV